MGQREWRKRPSFPGIYDAGMRAIARCGDFWPVVKGEYLFVFGLDQLVQSGLNSAASVTTSAFLSMVSGDFGA
jgi:hypothetical protein